MKDYDFYINNLPRIAEKRDRESFLEESFAATAPEYLKSIKEVSVDYNAWRIKRHDEVFGQAKENLHKTIELMRGCSAGGWVKKYEEPAGL